MNCFDRIRFPLLSAAIVVALAGNTPSAHAQVRIIGGLSNFDVPNDNEHECNEFDIEFEGPHPEDVYHTYHNGNYGSPVITALPGNIGIRVVYSLPRHATAPHAIEHFGVSISSGHPITAQRFNWVIGGVNPPYPPPPPPPPPPPLAMPLLETEIIYLPTGAIIRETVTNVDTLHRPIWVQRRAMTVQREVALEELMPNDPLIEQTNPIDLEPELLVFGTPLVTEDDAPPAGDLNSTVIVYDVFNNRVMNVGGEPTNTPGTLITCLLTAAVTMGDNCPAPYLPMITTQPQNATSGLDGAVLLTAAATGDLNYGSLEYVWRHEGVDVPDSNDPVLDIDPVTAADAGAYTLIVSNDCGRVTSRAAYLTVVIPPPCPADYDRDGIINSNDFFDFLGDFFDSRGNADLNHDLQITSQDFFEFLAHFFSGC